MNNDIISSDSEYPAPNDWQVKYPGATSYIVDVQQDPFTGDSFIELSQEIIERSGFKDGDVLEWLYDAETNSVSLRKKDDVK